MRLLELPPEVVPLLHRSAERGDIETVRSLIEAGTDIDAVEETGRGPLHYAASRGHENVVEALLAKGALVDVSDDSGRTLLHEAARKDHNSTVECLIGNHAEVNANNKQGLTALDYATDAGFADIVVLLDRDVYEQDRARNNFPICI